MSPALLVLVSLLFVLQAVGAEVRYRYSVYSGEDVEHAEYLDWHLQRCLGRLPRLPGMQGLQQLNDLPDVPWLPVAKVRQYDSQRRPGDICREEVTDIMWEEGSTEEAIAAATTCVLNHYKHVMAVDGLAAMVKTSLDCVATLFKGRM